MHLPPPPLALLPPLSRAKVDRAAPMFELLDKLGPSGCPYPPRLPVCTTAIIALFRPPVEDMSSCVPLHLPLESACQRNNDVVTVLG